MPDPTRHMHANPQWIYEMTEEAYEAACKLCICLQPNAAGRRGPHHQRDCPQYDRKWQPMPRRQDA